MYIPSSAGHIAHLQVSVPGPLVPDTLGTSALVGLMVSPGITKACSEYNCVESVCTIGAEERVSKLSRSVHPLEKKPHSVLWIFVWQSAGITGDSEATVDLEFFG